MGSLDFGTSGASAPDPGKGGPTNSGPSAVQLIATELHLLQQGQSTDVHGLDELLGEINPANGQQVLTELRLLVNPNRGAAAPPALLEGVLITCGSFADRALCLPRLGPILASVETQSTEIERADLQARALFLRARAQEGCDDEAGALECARRGLALTPQALLHDRDIGLRSLDALRIVMVISNRRTDSVAALAAAGRVADVLGKEIPSCTEIMLTTCLAALETCRTFSDWPLANRFGNICEVLCDRGGRFMAFPMAKAFMEYGHCLSAQFQPAGAEAAFQKAIELLDPGTPVTADDGFSLLDDARLSLIEALESGAKYSQALVLRAEWGLSES